MRRIGWARASLLAVVVGTVAACGSTVQLGATESSLSSDGLSSNLGQQVAAPTTGPTGAALPTDVATSPSDDATTPVTDGDVVAQVTDTVTTGTVSSSVASTGFGWDRKSVYIGFPTANDAAAAFKAGGANFDNGDLPGDVKAAVAEMNRNGGLFGRQVVPVFYDVHTTDVLTNAAGVAQAVCTYFTQDRPVIAVVNGAPQFDALPSFHTCLEKKHVTLISMTNTLFSDKDYATLGPHLFTLASLSTDSLVPTFVDALNRMKYFTGWNTGSGKPGSAAVKVGVLLPDDSLGHYVYNLFAAKLKSIGFPVAAKFFYSGTTNTNASSEVIQFKAAGVTHVLNLPPVEADIGLFQVGAQQQGYHPRYGFTSFNLPASIETNGALAPAPQQVGSLGIGWQPYNDTNNAHDPGATPGAKRCIAAMAKGGQTFDAGQRRAKGNALGVCDAYFLIQAAAIAGKGLTGDNLRAGMPLIGQSFLTSATFRSALSSRNQGLPGYYRDEAYNASCSCFIYSGPNRPFTR